MSTLTGKRTASRKAHITKRSVDALQPAEKPYIAWDDRLTGFGVRVLPSATKSFILNYRPGPGGRKAPTGASSSDAAESSPLIRPGAWRTRCSGA